MLDQPPVQVLLLRDNALSSMSRFFQIQRKQMENFTHVCVISNYNRFYVGLIINRMHEKAAGVWWGRVTNWLYSNPLPLCLLSEDIFLKN
jgi:hypothetical protein